MIVQKGVVDLQNDYLDLGFSRYVHKSAQLHDSVVIEANVTIGERVKIKKGTVLKSGVVIKSNVSIGEHCSIGSGTIIGNSGFGAERDLDDRIYMMPHVGGVIIKDRVYVGSNTTIVAGTIEPTFIDNEVKIDDLSVIAHNCHIQKSVIVCGGSSIGGSVLIGERSWIGSGAIILQSTKIGSDVTIGIGGVVRRNLKDKIVVLGNPAEKLSSYIAIKRKLNKI
jgi:UDP-3-O-[3-hydroxymyristoyl] glucosamine N-acyltransferase